MRISSSILFVIFIVGVAVAFFLALYKPVSDDISRLQMDIGKGQRRSIEDQMVTQVLDEMSLEVDELRLEVNRMREELLPADSSDRFMKDLRSLFQRAGIKGCSIFPRGLQDRNPFEVSVMELKVKSGFKEVYNFLQGVEDLPYVVLIENVKFLSDIKLPELLNVEMILSAPVDNL